MGRHRASPGSLLLTSGILFLAGCEEVSVNVMEVALMELSPEDVTLFEGEKETVFAIPRSPGGHALSGRSIEWSTDDPGVAAVSASGVVRGHEPGTTTLRARSEGVEGTALVAVLRRPLIALSDPELELRGISGDEAPVEESVAITNEREGELFDLSFSVETEGGGTVEWLSAALEGTVAPTVLTVSATVRELLPGSYRGSIFVSSPGAENTPQEVRVVLEVEEPPPEIHLDPTAISLNSTAGSHEAASQEVRVKNAGGRTLDGLSATIRYLEGTGGWLRADFDSTTAPTTLTLEARARELSVGTYRAEVEVSSPAVPGGSQSVEVVFNVSRAGASAPPPGRAR